MVYRDISLPAYTQTGTGVLNDVQASDAYQLSAMVGSMLNKQLDSKANVYVEGQVGYDFNHGKDSIEVSYVGSPGVTYTNQGVDNGGVLYDAGFGI